MNIMNSSFWFTHINFMGLYGKLHGHVIVSQCTSISTGNGGLAAVWYAGNHLAIKLFRK